MSKAFKKEVEENDDEVESTPVELTKNYVTPTGYAALQNELRQLFSEERPKVVEVVRWAAGNGDRSENGDYIYGKKRLREIDRRIRYLTHRLESAEVVNPESQKNFTKVFFGATVTYVSADKTKKTIKIVGFDEADISKNTISWISPLAKALLKAEVGDEVKLHMPEGADVIKILKIIYE